MHDFNFEKKNRTEKCQGFRQSCSPFIWWYCEKKRLQPLGHQKINNWKYLLNPYREYCLAIQKLQRKSTICFQAYKSSIKKDTVFNYFTYVLSRTYHSPIYLIKGNPLCTTYSDCSGELLNGWEMFKYIIMLILLC